MSVQPNYHLIVILGPTAVGKTELSLKLAKKFGADILSTDSRQIFKEMSIGTAKPTPAELTEVRHHFIDHISVHNEYSAGIFEDEAIALLQQLFEKNPIQMAVGGSGLYIQALCTGFNKMPPIPNAIREQVNKLFNENGIEILLQELQQRDPDFLETADLNNHRRLQRALEVSLASGKPFSHFKTGEPKKRNFQFHYIGLSRDRKELHERIEHRVNHMFTEGLMEEVQSLFPYRDQIALQTVGYQELFPVIEGKEELMIAKEKITAHTRQYAKRQFTWFRKLEGVSWFHPDSYGEISDHIDRIISNN